MILLCRGAASPALSLQFGTLKMIFMELTRTEEEIQVGLTIVAFIVATRNKRRATLVCS